MRRTVNLLRTGMNIQGGQSMVRFLGAYFHGGAMRQETLHILAVATLLIDNLYLKLYTCCSHFIN